MSSLDDTVTALALSNALVDYTYQIPASLLKELKQAVKGVSDAQKKQVVLERLKSYPMQKFPGGSATNVLAGLANLGVKTALLGAIGNTEGQVDEDGRLYLHDLERHGILSGLVHQPGETGNTFTLITEDKERAFIACLGVSGTLEKQHLNPGLFQSASLFHTTGYEVDNMAAFTLDAMAYAKAAGLTVTFDVANAYLAKKSRTVFLSLLPQVDVLFANEEEAVALAQTASPDEAAKVLSESVDIAVVKLGSKGAIIQQKDAVYRIPVYPASLVNTNGAGDGFAAGFLYGQLQGYDLELSGRLGAFYAKHVVEQEGPRLPFRINAIERRL